MIVYWIMRLADKHKSALIGAFLGGLIGLATSTLLWTLLVRFFQVENTGMNPPVGLAVGISTAAFVAGLVTGGIQFSRKADLSAHALGRLLVNLVGQVLLALGTTIAFGGLGGYLGLTAAFKIFEGPDFKNSPSPGAGIAVVFILVALGGGAAVAGICLGLITNAFLSLHNRLKSIQVALAAIGYGVAVFAIVKFQTLSGSRPVSESPIPNPVAPAPTPSTVKPPPTSEAANRLASDPNWLPADSFEGAKALYSELLYPGAKAARAPLDKNDMFLLATADELNQVATFYRARIEPKVDTPEKFIGMRTDTEGKITFVGVDVKDGLTFISLSTGTKR